MTWKLLEGDVEPLESEDYSVSTGSHAALAALVSACGSVLPVEVTRHLGGVRFSASSPDLDTICFPCPLREQELGAALKGLEGCLAGAVADLRYGRQDREIDVDVGQVTCFLMSAYLTTLDGMGKGDTKIKKRLPSSLLPCLPFTPNLRPDKNTLV
jgi:hypothetical protein